MAIIDIDKMYWEMKNVMICNYKGKGKDRFLQAKKDFLNSVEEIINENKIDLIKEIED